MPELLSLHRVCRNFSHGIFQRRTVQAVQDVSFSLERGKTFGLVGNSGCGKTTLSRLITRLLPLSSGKIYFEGQDISLFDRQTGKSYHQKVQMIFQNPESSLDPTMRIQDSLLEVLQIHGIGQTPDERMENILQRLAQVGLSDHLLSRYPHQISGGEAQRLAICRALLLNPQVLLLDEPTAMLDVSVQASILNLLKELQQSFGLTYLYITHDIELLRYMGHTIGVMQQGRLVELGSREQVLESPSHPYTQMLLCAYTDWK